MTQDDSIKFVLTSLGVVSLIGGFIYWHFKTVNGFKDDIHKLELKQKELENRDELQQQTINQLNEFYPMLKSILESLNNKRK